MNIKELVSSLDGSKLLWLAVLFGNGLSIWCLWHHLGPVGSSIAMVVTNTPSIIFTIKSFL